MCTRFDACMKSIESVTAKHVCPTKEDCLTNVGGDHAVTINVMVSGVE